MGEQANCHYKDMGRYCLHVLLLILMVNLCQGVIVFQQPTSFGTMQIQLSTTSGFISTSTSNTFTFANPGYQNITSLGLALCGYDVPTPTTLQFRAEASFDSVANSIVVLILPLNTTKLAFINYYVIITTQQVISFLIVQNTCIQPLYPYNTSYLGTSQSYTIPSPFVSNSSSIVTAIPYIRSVNNIVVKTFNFVQITGVISLPATNQFNISLMTNYNYQSEVCLSVVCYWNSIGLKYNLLNISYSNNFLVIDSSSLTQNLATVSQQNFTLNNIYGPVFNRKCLVGFQGFTMNSTIRQTISFNLTGNGIYGITSSSNNYNLYSWFCMAKITCQGQLAQYYPVINDCEQTCSVLNCTVCDTSTSCSQCDTGFYINSLFRCSACISNCNNCTNPNNCTLCASGFYYNLTACVPCPQFCNACNSASCTSCQYGYYSSGFQCVKCSSVLPYCSYCATGKYCSICPSGYYTPGSMQGCLLCSQALSGCSTCGSSSYCTSCQSGYYLSGNLCKTCVFTVTSCCPTIIANCSVCKSVSVCGSCTMGYYLSNSNQTCSPCVTNMPSCLTCSNGTTCTLCNTTYFINPQNQCISCISSISQCTTCSNSTYCTFCQLPFIAVNGSCFNCSIWPLNNLYFLDSNNVCQPCSAITPNCILCTTDQECTQCSDLYYLSSYSCNLCSDSITNCLSCYSEIKCNICTPGYYPSNGTACSLCSSVVSHCTTCSLAVQSSTNTSTVVCMNCEEQYYLNSTECTSCKQTISFCLTCANNYQCTVCQQGYFISSTLTCITCIELIIGCSSCQSSSICLICAAGYYLINNYCTQCKMAINNCYSCGKINSTLTCSNCLDGYYLGTNFICYLCNTTLQFCSACSSSTVCTSCLSGYVVNYNSTCSLCTYLITNCEYCSSTKCLKCLSNYIIDNYGDCQSCSKYISGCLSCAYSVNNLTSQSQLNCTNCSDGYIQYLSGSISKCIACNISISNCVNCVNLTSCSACNNISFLNSKNTCSLCSLHIPNCLYCNGSSSCQSCSGAYYLTSNLSCEYCNPSQFGNDGTALKQSLCLTCKYIASIATCLSCIQGYFVYQNGCRSCGGKIVNCISCTTSTFCIACDSGYYLSSTNAECISCPVQLAYCSTCDFSGVCQQCQSDCYLNTTLNQCIKCSQITYGCSSCTSNGTCVICADGYYMSGLACISCSDTIANCLLCTSSSACSLYSTNYTDTVVSTSFLTDINSNIWMYIALGCFGFIIICILACIIWRRYKAKEKELELKDLQSATKSQTDRELNLSEATQANDVQINHRQLCQHCKIQKFDVMNIELLCSVCELKKKENKHHFIRKDITQQKKAGKKKDEGPIESKVNNKKSKLESKNKVSKRKSRQLQQQSEKSSKKPSIEEHMPRASERKTGNLVEVNGGPSLRYTESEYFDAKDDPPPSRRSSKNVRKISKSHL